MSKSIYEKALDVIENIDRNLPSTWLMGRDNLMKIKQTLEQAQKQEQEHIEYSKKVQEQFSNNTKRIGELESKLIKQEKLLELYKEYFEYSEMLKDGRKFGGRMLMEHERDKLSEEIKELEK